MSSSDRTPSGIAPALRGGAIIRCAERLELIALAGIPIVQPGDDLPALVCDALERSGVRPESGRDAIVITSKVLSRAEDRFVDLAGVSVSPRAEELAAQTHKDPRLVQLILEEASAVSRTAPGVIVVRHRLGFVSANAGIDESNVRGTYVEGVAQPARGRGDGPWVLLLPRDPDGSARAIRGAIRARFASDVGVVVSDSFGRPFRLGTVGAAIGVAGLPPLWDQRGGLDLHGRTLQHTVTALADQVAAAADLVAGQGDEGRPVVVVRGLHYTPEDDASAGALVRAPDQDLYA
jgi:coenzyme F420-0:L-glutamate ligase/coenzyme F420-1:gamma-L-glutamate ligase